MKTKKLTLQELLKLMNTAAADPQYVLALQRGMGDAIQYTAATQKRISHTVVTYMMLGIVAGIEIGMSHGDEIDPDILDKIKLATNIRA